MRYAGWYGYAIIKGLGADAQTLLDIMFNATINYKLFWQGENRTYGSCVSDQCDTSVYLVGSIAGCSLSGNSN